jgi:hypothetical protein
VSFSLYEEIVGYWAIGMDSFFENNHIHIMGPFYDMVIDFTAIVALDILFEIFLFSIDKKIGSVAFLILPLHLSIISQVIEVDIGHLIFEK